VTTLLKKSIVESKPFKVLIYDGSGHLGNQTMTTSDMDYADTTGDGANGHLVSNPLKRLKRQLLRSSFPRETTTREYRLSLSASRYPDQTRLWFILLLLDFFSCILLHTLLIIFVCSKWIFFNFCFVFIFNLVILFIFF
jgi:hypothetical protein